MAKTIWQWLWLWQLADFSYVQSNAFSSHVGTYGKQYTALLKLLILLFNCQVQSEKLLPLSNYSLMIYSSHYYSLRKSIKFCQRCGVKGDFFLSYHSICIRKNHFFNHLNIMHLPGIQLDIISTYILWPMGSQVWQCTSTK